VLASVAFDAGIINGFLFDARVGRHIYQSGCGSMAGPCPADRTAFAIGRYD
jgi:hypothetical protein